jgi:hypothetical protein
MMIDIYKIRVGDKVHYRPTHYGKEEYENGIVKEIRIDHQEPYQPCLDSVWVVYNCDDKWVDYKDYTSAKTNLCDLHPGWK